QGRGEDAGEEGRAGEGDEGRQSEVTDGDRARLRPCGLPGQRPRDPPPILAGVLPWAPTGDLRRLIVFVEIVRLFTVVLLTAVGFIVGQERGATARASAFAGMIGCLAGYTVGGFMGRLLERVVGAA